MRYPMLMLVVLMLAGCERSTLSDKAPCRAPVDLPDRGISQGEAFRFWARDRQALVECGAANGVVE